MGATTVFMSVQRQSLSAVITAIRVMLPVAVVVSALCSTALAVQGPEHYRYAVSLWGLPAGHATMSMDEGALKDGRPIRRLRTTMRSNDVISWFFPVRNTVNSLVDPLTGLPRRLFFQRREGSRHEDFDVTFDRVANRVTTLKDGQPSVHDLEPNTHDLLSCIYFLRTMPDLKPGASAQLNIHHDRKNYHVTVNVEAIEQVSGPWGTREAIRLLAVMPFRGIFLNEGNIRFWLTNTDERIPVMMEARVIVGSVRAVLTNAVP